ncbi:heavy-metal-associated domain-containing protein [Proteiniborus sp. MB09-C3]|uniref:heavy-metal-associated domain-containing protein n=1 Tax=Proteiniborus sp. MB09-C3 TaxID=3050072 RepID=UPI002556C006|nr:heavy-metal-associated domain-containing protein [Proteiniborus sp. MB09-C3]WIV12367.1 heavy-metal-associated domain-containing protein [Proteiniborus sp. MB09-C3]
MKNVTLQLEALTCPSCVKKIEVALSNQNGVEEVKVLFNSSKVKVSYDENALSADAIVKVVSNLGFDVLSKK